MSDATKQADHTPGPWRTPGPTETKMAPIHTEEVVVAHVGAKSLDYDENDANARLVAAAPELLEAAKEAVSCLQNRDASMQERVDVAAAVADAITKAKGDTDG